MSGMSDFSDEMSKQTGVQMSDKEIEDQILWHEKVSAKVLRETGCFLSHQALAIVVEEFSKLVKQKQEEQNKDV